MKLHKTVPHRLLLRRVKAWFRYQHGYQHAARDDHSDFLGVLSYVEHFKELNLFNGHQGRTDAQDWKLLLGTLDELTFAQLDKVHDRILAMKSEKLGRKLR